MLYDSYSSAIYGVILRIVRDEEIAEEAMQDCFIKIWNKFEQYDSSKGRLFTWMINIARNQALDQLRSSEVKRVNNTDSIDDKFISPGVDSINPDTIGIHEMLKKLPSEQKKLIDLMYFEGYSQSEIAEEYGIPLGTIKTRVRSAMNQLRELFSN